MVVQQFLQRFAVEFQYRFQVFVTVYFAEMLCQQNNIVSALTQGWYHNFYCVYTVYQVFPEAVFVGQFSNGHIGGTDQADVYRNRFIGAQADDLELGIDTIKRRSEGLLKFAETYRNLNKITTLNLKKIYVRNLFENLHHLMQPTLEQKNIDLEIILKDTDLQLEADTNLLEQVLINLLVNAIEAVKEKTEPRIILSAYTANNKKIIVKVTDNGTGMTEEVLDKIFIPFFSTKKHGSGIGLSLCKQIMMLHKGTMQVQSTEGEGTSFLLQF
jgi:signal transduction histidine kinase